MKIKIRLLSDLCLHSGDIYNSVVDTDVVYDSYGFPYIPAKRLKGCIREAALELQQLGLITKKDYIEVFGKEGRENSAFSISNAYLEKYSELKEGLDSCNYAELKNPQNVLNQYSYIRRQTAVDLETGVADKNSLRSIRVVKKGLVFEASCHWNKEVENAACLEKAIRLVKHMGMSRTRGFGLVEMSLEEEDSAFCHVSAAVDKWMSGNKNQACEERFKIKYTIKLKSSLICKSPQGNQAVTEDYISGSKVLGLIAGAGSKEEYKKLIDAGEIIVSNAYIMNGKKRCMPAEISLQKEKDQKYDEGIMNLKNMLFADPIKDKQMTPANIPYIDEKNTVKVVDTEITYHHQRPNDKSIGRATNEDGSSFYQLASISEGQSFCGYIYANQEQVRQIITAVKRLKEVRMGYGRWSGFGEVEFMLEEIEPVKKESRLVNEVEIVLLSDMILYNKFGSATTELRDLKKELCERTGVNDLEITNPFLRFVTIGGYNVTWGARKPMIYGFGKGSAFRLHSDQGFDKRTLEETFLGERVSEGYGEIDVRMIPFSEDVVVKKDREEANESTTTWWESPLMNALLENELKVKMQETVRAILEEKKFKIGKDISRLNVVVSKLRILFQTEHTYESLKENIAAIEKEDTRNLGNSVVDMLKPQEVLSLALSRLKEMYGFDYICTWNDEEIYRYVYQDYISNLKYFVATNKVKGEK